MIYTTVIKLSSSISLLQYAPALIRRCLTGERFSPLWIFMCVSVCIYSVSLCIYTIARVILLMRHTIASVSTIICTVSTPGRRSDIRFVVRNVVILVGSFPRAVTTESLWYNKKIYKLTANINYLHIQIYPFFLWGDFIENQQKN